MIGQEIIKLSNCHSTNDLVKQFASNNANHGFIVSTAFQQAGRGQRGNVWESEPDKNLMFSILLRPEKLLVEHQFVLTLISSLTLHELISQYVVDASKVSIKWPNDIYINELKVCGILIENTLRSTSIDYSIIGIGLNVLQTTFTVEHATSIVAHSIHTLDLDELLDRFIQIFNGLYLSIDRQDELKKNYLSKLLGYKTKRLFKVGETVFEGEIIDVDEFGRLILETNDGLRCFSFKEIKWLLQSDNPRIID